jgi:hypothetical protein
VLKENLHISTINELVEKHPDKIGKIPSITPKKAKDWIDFSMIYCFFSVSLSIIVVGTPLVVVTVVVDTIISVIVPGSPYTVTIVVSSILPFSTIIILLVS